MDVKIRKILFLEPNEEFHSYISNVYLSLKKFCGEIVIFNRRENYFKYGKDEMNKMLLETVEREKPDYIFTWLTWDELAFDALLKIKKISPNTKTVAIFGDDVHQFEDFSRYYSLFFDYSFTTVKSFMKKYEDDGIRPIFHTSLNSTENFYPIKNEKIYDVTYIGSPKDTQSRYDNIKYLMDNGIRIKLFGPGWDKYPEFNEIYMGIPSNDEMVKIINQSKINLCFSKNNYNVGQMKSKIFEIGACNAFTLCEFAEDYLDYFKENEEIIFFDDKKEMLEKIKYYLNKDMERDRISINVYNKVINEYTLDSELKDFFNRTKNEKGYRELPKMNNKCVTLGNEFFMKERDEILDIVLDYDYVSFNMGNVEYLPFKQYLQVYSLEKTGKNVSLCNYNLYSSILLDYATFMLRQAKNNLEKIDFYNFLNINQIVVRKDYFLENFDNFKKILNGKGNFSFIEFDNIANVYIPLVRLKNYKLKEDYDKIKVCFDDRLIYTLYSLYYKKKFFSLVPFAGIIKSISGESFVFKFLIDKLKGKNII